MEKKFKKNPNGERNRQRNNWQEGADSLEKALVQFEPMIQKFARQYYHQLSKEQKIGVPFEDLCQQGRLGVILAYSRYLIQKEAQLSTFAYHYIKGAIIQYVDENSSPTVSGGKYIKDKARILEKYEGGVTIEKLVKKGTTYQTATAIQNIYSSPVRYGIGTNATFYNSETGAVEKYEIDKRGTTKDIDRVEGFHLEDFKQYITDEEFFALKNHYGIGCDRMTMKEVGEHLGGKSRKAVSYMINRALNKLRHVDGIEEYAPLAQ